jgi:hypothetical protein
MSYSQATLVPTPQCQHRFVLQSRSEMNHVQKASNRKLTTVLTIHVYGLLNIPAPSRYWVANLVLVFRTFQSIHTSLVVVLGTGSISGWYEAGILYVVLKWV